MRLSIACAALVLSASCSSSPEPIEPRTDATTSTRPTRPTSTITPPKLPAIAKRHDATGAANFVLYWVKVSNYTAQTGDTKLLRTISDPQCEGCNRYIDLYEETYAAGGYFKGSNWRPSDVAVQQEPQGFLVQTHISAPIGEFRNSESDRLRRGNDENSDLAFFVQRSGRSWVLAELILESAL